MESECFGLCLCRTLTTVSPKYVRVIEICGTAVDIEVTQTVCFLTDTAGMVRLLKQFSLSQCEVLVGHSCFFLLTV